MMNRTSHLLAPVGIRKHLVLNAHRLATYEQMAEDIEEILMAEDPDAVWEHVITAGCDGVLTSGTYTTPAGPEVHPPWALVCWAADGTVLRTTSLDSPSGGPFAWRPDRAGLGRLCRELDALLAQGPDADPSGLRSSYAALLSPELRAQLASLVPAAAALLA